MAYGMFDTRGKVDPFDKASPIKQCAITRFPPDLFFVLRVVQLLRGMANGEREEATREGEEERAGVFLFDHCDLFVGARDKAAGIWLLFFIPAISRTPYRLCRPHHQPRQQTTTTTTKGMGINDFSSAAQWAPLARRALKQEDRRRRKRERRGGERGPTTWRSDPVVDITALAVPLQLNM